MKNTRSIVIASFLGTTLMYPVLGTSQPNPSHTYSSHDPHPTYAHMGVPDPGHDPLAAIKSLKIKTHMHHGTIGDKTEVVSFEVVAKDGHSKQLFNIYDFNFHSDPSPESIEKIIPGPAGGTFIVQAKYKKLANSDAHYNVTISSTIKPEVKDTVQVTIHADPAPAPIKTPSDLAATAGNRYVILTWTEERGTLYRVERTGPGPTITKLGERTSGYRDENNVVNGIKYFYRITPVRNNVLGTASTRVSVTPDANH